MRGLLVIEILYHQIIKGNKTQTRRSSGLEEVNHKPDYWQLLSGMALLTGEFKFVFNQSKQRNPDHVISTICKPRYTVGEVLYLKEPYAIETLAGKIKTINYAFDHNSYDNGMKWRNKLFMPAEAGREFIRITGIKCERLLDISDDDCIAEGIEESGESAGVILYNDYGCLGYGFHVNPKWSFITLFRLANKMKPTAEVPNIWVFCYSFEYLPNFKP